VQAVRSLWSLKRPNGPALFEALGVPRFPLMISIVSSRSASFHLSQLREWIISEWGKTDPFEGVYDDLVVPPPLLVVDDRQLLGGLTFTNAPVRSTDRIGLWINALFVLPKHRRCGIGSKLVAEAEVEASGVSVDDIFVYTDVPDFYQKLGWSIVDDAGTNTTLRKRIV